MKDLTSPFKRTYRSALFGYITVLTALAAVSAFAVYLFGARVAVQILTAVLASVLFDTLYCVAVKGREIHSDDIASATVTGILCALLCPVSAPLFIPLILSLAASVIKAAFGGRGRNMINPAFGASLVAELLFKDVMHSFTEPFKYHTAFDIVLDQRYIDAAVSASPLDYMLSGNELTELELPQLLFGTVAGKNGETSFVLLLLCGIALLIAGVSECKAGIAYISTLFVMAYIFPVGISEATYYAIWQVLTGTVMLVAVFGMNDPTTTPAYGSGRVIFGIGCGLLTYILRLLALPFDGATAALVIMNLTTPMINTITSPKPTRKKQGVKADA